MEKSKIKTIFVSNVYIHYTFKFLFFFTCLLVLAKGGRGLKQLVIHQFRVVVLAPLLHELPTRIFNHEEHSLQRRLVFQRKFAVVVLVVQQRQERKAVVSRLVLALSQLCWE